MPQDILFATASPILIYPIFFNCLRFLYLLFGTLPRLLLEWDPFNKASRGFTKSKVNLYKIYVNIIERHH